MFSKDSEIFFRNLSEMKLEKSTRKLKKLRHDILSHFLNGLNVKCKGVGKPKNNGLLRKKNTKGLIQKQKGIRMAGDGVD